MYLCIHGRGRVGAGIGVVCLALGLSHALAVELPPELRAISEGNAASLARLASAAATIEMEAYRNKNGDEMSFANTYSIWVKGQRVRQDYVARPLPTDQRRVRGPDGPDGAYVVYSAGPGERIVLTPTANFGYGTSPGGIVGVTPPDPDQPYGRNARLLHEYVTMGGGSSLARVLQARAQRSSLPSVADAVLDGLPCKLLEWDDPDMHVVSRAWIASSQGHMLKKRQVFYKGQLWEEVVVQLKDYGDGLFWFEQAQARRWKYGKLEADTHLRVTKLEPNVEVDDALFTLDGMGIAPGTRIEDHILNVDYRYGKPEDVPEDYVQSVLNSRPASATQPANTGPAGSTPASHEPAGPAAASSGIGPPASPAALSTLSGIALLIVTLGAVALGFCVVLSLLDRLRHPMREAHP